MSPAEREIARSAMQTGDELRSAADHEGALKHYRSAHAIMRVPTTGLAVAQTEHTLGLLLEALSTAMEVINLPGEADESVIFAKARAAATQLATQVRPLIPSVAVDVSPHHARYKLSIDGVEVSEAAHGLALKLNPGDHRLEVIAPGYASDALVITLDEGDTEPARVRFVLTLIPTALPPLAAAPRPVLPPPVLAPEPPAENTPAETRALVGFVAGGAVVLGGATAGIISALKTEQLRERCDDGFCGESRRNALRTANTLANVANIAIPVGLLGIAYAVYETLNAQSVDAKEHAAIEVRWMGPQTVGVVW